ncbi:MAG: AAA family ATPase [Thermodesulfobacteriota bacterium]
MIVVNEESPRWLKEIDRFLPLKSLLFIHGNVLDLVSFPVRRPETNEAYWTDDDLPNFFRRYLTGLGYKLVGFIDSVDGLYFPESEMERLYRDLAASRGTKPRTAAPAPSPSGNRTASAPGGAGSAAGPVPSETQPGAVQPPARAGGIDLNQIMPDLRAVVRNTDTPCAFVFNLASRLVATPGHFSREESGLLARILKASLECADVFAPQGGQFKNCLILLCDKLNDLPPFLYVSNPRAKSIFIDKPDTLDRSRFLNRTYPAFAGAEGPTPPRELVSRFAALTDGLTHYELMSLVHLSRRENLDVRQVDKIIQRFKYGVTESEWDKLDRDRLAGAEAHIKSRIKGQESAIARVVDIVKRARIGLAAGAPHVSSRPRGVLFLAGPTGVGKTEMAKSLADLLFGREDRCLRFDMSEYSAPHSDEKLLGAPPGYVGYEEGGQLTNALKENPFSVLLFDEIEKAHGGIFDKFLQILDDGRLTDGKGETVYFSETIIIFTSNLGTVSREDGPPGRQALVDPSMPFEKMQDIILRAIRHHFNFVLGRPEILNRFGDNFVVFDFIKPPVDEQIVDLMTSRLAQSTQEKWGLEIKIEPQARARLINLAQGQLHHGGRGIRNMVDSALVNPLTRFLFDQVDLNSKPSPGAAVIITDLEDLGPEAPYRFRIKAETKGL